VKYRKAKNSPPLAIRLPTETLERLRQLAESKGEAVSTMMRFAIHAGLPILERDLAEKQQTEQLSIVEGQGAPYKVKKKGNA